MKINKRNIHMRTKGNIRNKIFTISVAALLFFMIMVAGANAASLDKFGVVKLYETVNGGREWISKWDNGQARTWNDDSNDPYDSEFVTKWKGTGTYKTDGKGILKISGSAPRMYVIDPAQINSWHNVEITIYGQRVSDSSTPWGGIESVARTNHMIDSNSCDTRGIATRMRYDGHYDFEKETAHPDSTAIQNKVMWSGGMQKNAWIGYKYVVYDMPDGNVKLELWYDNSDGLNGGNWTKINELIDTGNNFGVGGTACKSGINPAMKLDSSDTRAGSETGKPNLAVYFRSDDVGTDGLLYKKVSVREINPLQSGSSKNYSISGIVRSSPGNTIIGAKVSDGIRSAVTDTDGAYIISNVPFGTYSVTASAAGYQLSTQSVTVNSNAIVNFSLIQIANPVGDNSPPIFSNIQSSGITSSGAAITWTTNEVSSSQVEYGTTISYGSFTILDSTLTSSHKQILSGLSPSTTYHYRVISKDSSGNLAKSEDNIFITADTTKNSHLIFNGADGYVEVPDSKDFSIPTTGVLTISFWIRPDALDFSRTEDSSEGKYIQFLGKGEFGTKNQIEWIFRMYDKNSSRPNRISFYVFNSQGGSGVGSYFQNAINIGEWIHVVARIDKRYTYIYKNGILRDKDYYRNKIYPKDGTAPLRMGTVTKDSYLKGALDNITIYNRILSDTEIKAIYNGNKPANGVVAEWKADKGSGSILPDDSKRGHNGTFHGGVSWFSN